MTYASLDVALQNDCDSVAATIFNMVFAMNSEPKHFRFSLEVAHPAVAKALEEILKHCGASVQLSSLEQPPFIMKITATFEEFVRSAAALVLENNDKRRWKAVNRKVFQFWKTDEANFKIRNHVYKLLDNVGLFD